VPAVDEQTAVTLQEVPLMRKTAADDDAKQAKPPPPGSIVSCCITLPDGSVCDVDISVRYALFTRGDRRGDRSCDRSLRSFARPIADIDRWDRSRRPIAATIAPCKHGITVAYGGVRDSL